VEGAYIGHGKGRKCTEILVGFHEITRHKWEDNIKFDLNGIHFEDVNWNRVARGSRVVGFCEDNSNPSDSIKCRSGLRHRLK
jgi:hypothetical protein